MELGYPVTLLRDGTAARSHEALHVALDIDGPTYAHAIVTMAVKSVDLAQDCNNHGKSARAAAGGLALSLLRSLAVSPHRRSPH
jgi:hypothetical protein